MQALSFSEMTLWVITLYKDENSKQLDRHYRSMGQAAACEACHTRHTVVLLGLPPVSRPQPAMATCFERAFPGYGAAARYKKGTSKWSLGFTTCYLSIWAKFQ